MAEVESLAQEQAIFQLNEDGIELSHKLISSNIDNITQAHIHLAPDKTAGSSFDFTRAVHPPS